MHSKKHLDLSYCFRLLTYYACADYPCRHGTTPGVITLTSNTLFFTSLMSSRAKMEIPVTQIIGIKKGASKTISVQFEDSGGSKTERFLWVYERGDLFGRLVGLGGRKWSKV
jgi:GRAM domain-containing protein 4